MGKNSNSARALEAYMDQGMSREQAQRQAFWDNVGQVALAGAGGALSGGFMSSGKLAVDYIGNYINTQKPASIGEAGVGQYRLTKPRNVDMPTVPIINLSIQDIPFEGGELPSAGNSLRNDAIARARTRLGLDKNSAFYLPASNVTRDGNEYILKITKASLAKMLSPADGGTVSLESIAVLDNLERIANNGVWFDGQGDRKGRAQIAGFDHLKTTVYIDGAPYLVDMRVRLVETTPGQGVDNVLYYYTPEEIVTIERVGTTPPTYGRRASILHSEDGPTLNQSIPQTAPGVNPAESASRSPSQLSLLLQKVKAEAREGLKKPYGFSEEAWAKLKSSLADPILADKMRKALGDYLGYSPEFQTTIAPLLDKTLAAMEDIVLWEGLDRSSQTWQDLQPLYQERKETVQWLENILQKMETLNEPQGEKAEELPKQDTELFTEVKDHDKMISGALNPESSEAGEHAERYYEEVRHMSTDVAKIAQATGIAEAEIQTVKEFLFLEEHDLGGKLQRFYPDFMIARSWQRLVAGTPEPHDLTLLHHEIMERDLMRMGYTQAEAHDITSKVYNYKREADEFYDKIKKHKKDK